MSEPFIGEIKIVGFNFPPRGWAHCDGQLLPIAQNTALFSLLGTTFGGDGRTTFGLPGLRGRSPRHVGTGAGLPAVRWGEKGGTVSHTLSVAEMPAHAHPIQASSGQPDETNPKDMHPATLTNGTEGYAATPTTGDFMKPTANMGGNQSFSLLNPFLGVYFCIALTGIFPSRS